MINSNIYGTAEQWTDVSATSGWNVETMKYKIARFGGGGNTLADGYGYGIEINKPIDKSLSWCGLGNFSTWSKLEYHKFAADFELIAKDNRSSTNFSWNTSNGSNSGIYLTEKSSVADTRYGALQRFSPNAIMGAGTKINYNNGVTPLTQIPIKNCVLVPYFRVCRTLPTSASTSGIGLTNVVAWDYYGTTASTNHTTHPYIIGVYFQPYIYTNSTSTTRTAQTFLKRHSILDEISLQKDIPIDMDEPDGAKNNGVYAYNIFSPYSSINGLQIFGHSYNDFGVGISNDFIYYNKSAFASGSSSTFSNNIHGAILYPHDNAQMSTEYASSSYYVRFYYLEYYDGLQEWVRKQLACFGLFFTDVKAVAESGELNDDDMLLGILDDNNIGQGFYSHGEENEQQKQWNWDTTNDSEYNPSDAPEIDDNVYGRPWGFNSVSLADSTVRRYVMSPAELSNLGKYLWDIIDTTDADALIQNQTLSNFLTNNPLDCVISLKYFPFSDMSQASLTNLVLGKVTVPNVAGKPFGADSVTRSCGVKHIYHRFNDWRDYICDYFLYLPFCGTLKLDAETVVGRDICVYYAIDYTTGTCTAYVTTWDDDGAECYIDSASGNCSVDIPLSGVETATLTGELYNANENLKALKFNGIVGAAQGALNIAGAAGSGSKLAAAGAGLQAGAGIVNAIHDKTVAEWNISQTQIPLKMIGASSGCNSFQGELTPCVLIFYPETDDKFSRADYLHTVGAACCESGTIGDYKGYAEIVNADLSGLAATADEINMIRNQLSKGVYL